LLLSPFESSSSNRWFFVCTGKNKAKMAIPVDKEVKPEVEIWQRPKKINFFDPGFLFAPSDSF